MILYLSFVCLYVAVIVLGVAVMFSVFELGAALLKFNGYRGLRAAALLIIAVYASSFIMPLFLTAYVRVIQL